MRAAYENFKDQGFEVLSVSVQEGDTEVADFIDRYSLTYPLLMDRTGQTSTSYEVTTTPTTYFISPDGAIVDTMAGVVTQAWLEKNINRYITA